MLKYLYKTFLITFLSWSLLVVQSNAVFAQADVGTTTTDNNGVITHKQNFNFNKISDADMLTSITMLAGGFVTARMIASYRPVTMDVMIAGAAGAAFVAGEVMSNMKFKGTIDALTLEIQKKNDGTVNEEQIQRLTDLKTSYEEAKKTTKTKKTMQLAAAVGFGAAAATATYMAFQEDAQVVACAAAFKAAQGTLATCSASGATANPEAPACGVCAANLVKFETSFMSFTQTRTVPALSALKDRTLDTVEKALASPTNYCVGKSPGPVVAAIPKALMPCKTALGSLIANQTDADVKKLLASVENKYQDLMNLPKNYVVDNNYRAPDLSLIEKTLDIFFPRAEAGWLPLLGLGASTAAAFFLITGATATEIDFMMFVPKNRAIGFALFAGLAYMASRSSDNVIKQLDENIEKVNSILADLNKLALGTKAQALTKSTISIKTVNPGASTIGNGGIVSTKGNTPCLTSNDTTNCEKLENKLTSMPGFGALPESFQTLAAQTMGVGTGVSGSNGISGSTLTAAENLGAKSNAIRNLLKNREASMAKLTGNKFVPSKEKDKLQAKLGARISKSLGKSGTTATGMMASLGAMPIDSKAIPKEEVADDLKKETVAAANIADISAPAAKDDSMKLDFSDSSSGDVAGMGLDSGSGSGTQYDIPDNDISGDNGLSIFEVISLRYLKSGYPKLLEEIPSKN